MKKKNFMVLMMVLAFLVGSVGLVMGDDISQDATALDKVTVSYSESGTVSYLGMVSNDAVSLSITTTWSADEPGEAATPSAGGSPQAPGGRLHWTTYEVATQKITVKADTVDASGQGYDPSSYNSESVSVRIGNGEVTGDDSMIFTNGGKSGAESYGTITTGYTDGWVTIVDSASTAKDIIEGIGGTHTYTGTGTGDGAPVEYKMTGNPGVTKLHVLYTIMNES
jgi:hypothetical protein